MKTAHEEEGNDHHPPVAELGAELAIRESTFTPRFINFFSLAQSYGNEGKEEKERGGKPKMAPTSLAMPRPVCQRDLIAVRRPVIRAVYLLKLGISIEFADEAGVVALHDNRHGHYHRPADGLAVCLDGLPEGLGVFIIGGLLGIE